MALAVFKFDPELRSHVVNARILFQYTVNISKEYVITKVVGDFLNFDIAILRNIFC